MSDIANQPDGWELVRLADHTTVKARLGWKGLKAEEYIEDGFIFLATPNLKANQIDFERRAVPPTDKRCPTEIAFRNRWSDSGSIPSSGRR